MIDALALLALSLLAPPLRAAVNNPDTLVYLERDDNDTLDPDWAGDSDSRHVILNIYEGLLGFKGASTAEFEPVLAQETPTVRNGLISKDGRTYTFRLRPGVKFQDGSPLRPEDVRYSLLRGLLIDCGRGRGLSDALLGTSSSCDDKGAPLPGAYAAADAAIGLKGDAVVIRLKKPFTPLLSMFARFMPVVSQSWCAAHGEWDGSQAGAAKLGAATKQDSYLHSHANGTGPYRLERWDKGARQMILLRNESYRRGPARLKRIVLKVVPETITRALMLKNGDADVADASIVDLPVFSGLPGVDVLQGLTPLVRSPIIFFNFKIDARANPDVGSGALDGEGIPPDFFADIELRRAFAAIIDAPTYIRDALRGRGRPASGFIPPGLVGYSRDGLANAYDPALAEKLFRGARGGEIWRKGFRFTIVVNAGSAWRPILAGLIKKNVEALNPRFKIGVRPVLWSTFLDLSKKGAIPLFIGGTAGSPDPHDFAFPLMRSDGDYQKRFGYSNPEADRLVDAGIAELDPARRAAIYLRLQKIAADDVPFVPVVEGEGDVLRAQRKWVRGYRFNPVFPAAPAGSYYYDLWKAEP